MRRLAALLLAAACHAQGANLPTPLPADLDALAKRVEAAHQPKGPVPAVTAFRGSLELHLVAADAERAGKVDLAVKFLQWQRPDSDKVRSLIRYEVRDAGQAIERGRDQRGFWHLFQGEARELNRADFAQDLANCERDTNLARQLLRFLSPGEVLRAMTAPTPVREEPLQLGREPAKPCLVVEGGLPTFPLLQQGGEDAPVQVKVYVTKAEGRLLALEVSPLVDGRPEPARAELVRLLDLKEQDGLLVPRKLEHLFRAADGRMRLQSRAGITTLSLRPELRVEDFDRPKK